MERNVQIVIRTLRLIHETKDGRKGRAMASNRSSSKEPERGKAPDFTIRARQGPNSDYFYNVGAAWRIMVDNKEALSISLFTLPLPDDKGRISMLALVPKD